MKKIKVVELFAGVGGFRVGLEKANKDIFELVFANQWEPNRKIQHAYNCYVSHFGTKNTSNENIEIAKHDIPKQFDLLVGGFPCQDYSVAATGAKGIEGKKGVLWWEIADILKDKKPKYVLLENVDRLLLSPSQNRGRDFAIMLMNFYKNGYNVEWQVINAAEYGMVQRRRRVFIFATKKNNLSINKNGDTAINITQQLNENGIINKTFKIQPFIENTNVNEPYDFKTMFEDEMDVTQNWINKKFDNTGVMINGVIHTFRTKPLFETKDFKTLGSILEKKVDDKYLLTDHQIEKAKYVKGSKRILRHKPNGEPYYYAEGQMSLTDDVNKPGRTMLTSEASINRSTHFIDMGQGKIRFITPVEAERLNGFADNWTNTGMPEKMRYFCMGNALVVDIVQAIGTNIIEFNEK